MALRQARILSSETDNTIKQEQTTNVSIKVQQPQVKNDNGGIAAFPGISAQGSGYIPTQGFTTQPMMEGSQYPSVHPTSNPIQSTTGSEGDGEKEALTIRLEFLELLLRMYQSNPLKINALVIADNRLFMQMVKLLTGADKVELILDEDISCECGCTGNGDRLIYVSKVLITMNGRTEDLKYSRNDVYSQFTKYGISTKIVSQ